MNRPETEEHQRLADSKARRADWKNWGPYVSERAWGTVREDYSEDGEAWHYFPHEHARSRVYRWNEDGLGGFCNRFQNVCLAFALWNEHDPILKERLFGLTGREGNHGEDVKEYYFYLDGTPTHSYMKMLYKYPQAEYPYELLVRENAQRDRFQQEFELIDAMPTVFEESRYFDVFIEYAKADDEDILCRITAVNRGPDPAPLHLLPHVWYRNTWSWGYERERPAMEDASNENIASVRLRHPHLGDRRWDVLAPGEAAPPLLFTENETNTERLFGVPNSGPYVKDGIHEAVVRGRPEAVNPAGKGTKVAAHVRAVIAPGETYSVKVRFGGAQQRDPFADFDAVFEQRIGEADAFYEAIHAPHLGSEGRLVQRQAMAGLLWSKQFYHYSPELWLDGDPAGPTPPADRKTGRNADWRHLYNLDVVSMPDKWEYPWYAAWDLAFHMIPMAQIDPEWAKRQLVLLLREWYTHPNGQLPAYEWSFGDVNPPVHAWAALRVYQVSREATGNSDTDFLERIFQKLLLNFTWWVNRKDHDGHNVFQGGFLGLDNIGVFDRSKPLPDGGHLDQADGTAWMGMYCLNMLAISLELARTRPAYEDMATKFFEHFVYIANSINKTCAGGLWSEEEGFYFDALHTSDGGHIPLEIKSFVGLIPLFAVEVLDADLLESLPRFQRRMEWFIRYRPHLIENLSLNVEPGARGGCLLSLVNRRQVERVMERMLDEAQFLSPNGLRAMSKEHEANPYSLRIGGQTHEVAYEPADATTGLFGGNSNWRGPIWFPLNYLMIESLRRFDDYYGDDMKVDLPRGSDHHVSLGEVADDLSRRLASIFLRDENTGRRAFNGGEEHFQNDPHWRDHILFYEYFHGDNGAGIGASHQTGWTALVAALLQGLDRVPA